MFIFFSTYHSSLGFGSLVAMALDFYSKVQQQEKLYSLGHSEYDKSANHEKLQFGIKTIQVFGHIYAYRNQLFYLKNCTRNM